MESENPFKCVEFVSAADPNYNPNELIYLSDDEDNDESLTKVVKTSIQIEMSTPNHSDDSNEQHPLSVKVEPEEVNTQDILNGDAEHEEDESIEIFRNENFINFYPHSNAKLMEDLSHMHVEDQFEIIKPEIVDLTQKEVETDQIDKIKLEESISMPSTSADLNVTMTNDKSNESLGSILDHSYSQSQKPVDATVCDEMIRGILEKSGALNDSKSVDALKYFSDLLKQYLLVEEDPRSQTSLLLGQMDAALDKIKMDAQLDKIEIPNVNGENHADESLNNVPAADESDEKEVLPLKNEETRDQESEKLNVKTEWESNLSDIAMDVQIKEEPIVRDIINSSHHFESNGIGIEDSVIKDTTQLKVYATKAQELNGNFTEINQTLLDSVFISRDDIENGQKKLINSLKNLISLNAALLMEVGGKDVDLKDVDGLKKYRDNSLLKSPKSKNRLSRELTSEERVIKKFSQKSSEIATDADEESDNNADDDNNDSDDSINKLIDFRSLNQPKNKKIVNQVEKTTTKELKKDKKKEKENNNKDDSNVTSDSDMDSLRSNASDNDGNLNDSDMSEDEDEEEKMKRKLENKARELLLQSSDEESSEETYKTSSSSALESSDDERKQKRKKDKKKEEEVSDEKAQANKELPDSEREKVSDNEKEKDDVAATPIVSASIDNDDNSNTKEEEKTEDNQKEKKLKRNLRKTSFENEIFKANFLNSESESDDERGSKSPSSKRKIDESIKDSSKDGAIDLSSKTANPKVDLEKYFEKRAAELDSPKNIFGVKNGEPSTSKAGQFESPQKNQADAKTPTTPPSPPVSIDDIDCISISSESDSEISSTNAEGHTRRRKQLTEEELKEETKKAKKEEQERVKKLEEKHSRLSQFLTQRFSQCDVMEADELILDHSEKKDLEIAVHPRLVDQLKNHQIDGIKFMYNK